MKDAATLRFQLYLPKESRFTGKTLPKEEVFSYGRFQVHIDRYSPKEPKETVVMIHGLGQNGRYLSFIASRLLKDGYEVICPDLPFFGYTVHEGTVNYEDVIDLMSYLGDSLKKPVFMAGTGFGGTAAYDAACAMKSVKGVMTTMYPDPKDLASQVSFCGSEERYRDVTDNLKRWQWLLPGKKIPLEDVADFSKITNHPDASKIIREDPHAGKCVLQMRYLYSLMNHEFRKKPEEFDRCPVLLAMPEDDAWFAVRERKGFFERIKAPKCECVLPGAGHLPLETEGVNALLSAMEEFMGRIIRN